MAQIRQSNDEVFSASSNAMGFERFASNLAASCLVCIVFGATGNTTSVSDNINGSWPSALQAIDSHGTGTFWLFAFENAAAGTPTITATSTGTLTRMLVVEAMGVTSTCIQGSNAHAQDSVSIGTDTLTSNTITATAPGLLIGFACPVHGLPAPASGTSQFAYTYVFHEDPSRTARTSACLSSAQVPSSGSVAALFSVNITDDYYALAIILTSASTPIDPGFVSALSIFNDFSTALVSQLGAPGYVGIAVWTGDGTGSIVTPPSGWIQIYNGQINYDGADFYVWYNPSLIGGSDEWAVGTGNENIFLFAAYSPISSIADSSENIISTGTPSPADVPALSVTTAQPNSRVVWVGVGDPNGGAGNGFAVTAPSGYDERINAAGSQWTLLAICDQLKATSGATGTATGVFTLTGQSMGTCGIQIAFNPVSGLAVVPALFFGRG